MVVDVDGLVESEGPAPPVRQIGAVLLACSNLAGATVATLLALIGNGLRCDDACSVAPGWHNDPNAWQWSALSWLAVAVFVCSFLLFVAIAKRLRPPYTWIPVLVQMGALVLYALIATSDHHTRGSSDFLVYLFLFFGGTAIGSAGLTLTVSARNPH